MITALHSPGTRASVICLCLLALAAGSACPAQTSESFGGNIVLGWPTDSSVTVSLLFTSNLDTAFLEYGLDPTDLNQQTPLRRSIRANFPTQETISGLAPNTRYHYRLRYRQSEHDPYSAGELHSFQTQRKAGSTFTFTVVADSHLFTAKHCLPERYAQTLLNAHADSPDFHIDLGDTFRSDTIVRNQADLTQELVIERALAHRPFFNIVTADAPLFLVNGNHDSEYLFYSSPSSGMNPNLPVWASNARLFAYPAPMPGEFYSGDSSFHPEIINGGLRQSYYSWEWGDALFVVLDPYWGMPRKNSRDWSPVHGDAQYAWFRDTLRRSKAKYKFVFEHHVLGQGRGGVEMASQYEWGGQDPRRGQTFEQVRPGWEMPMHQLMVEAGVNAYFQGHDHLFAQGEMDGIVYVTVPMPGAGPPGSDDWFTGNEGDGNFDAYSKSFTLPNSGHLRVTVAPDEAIIEYVAVRLDGKDIGANREVLHTIMLRPKENRP